jgi:FdrA protein
MITKSEIRPGAYYDSVLLMQLQRNLAGLPGIDDAGVVMATPANKELLVDFNLLTEEGSSANPDDLLIVVRGENETDVDQAITQVDELIKKRRTASSQEFRPKSMDAAIGQLPDAKWVLISVPGKYAAGIAKEALENDKNVFLYSDNVSIEEEKELKTIGLDKGLLVMGPDCGTAIINGTGLGFANKVRQGNIGLVGASGTGIQAITSQVHNLGSGISQAIGTGGRDLKASIGAITAIQGLSLLANDDETKVIILVSKPPDSETAIKLLGAAKGIDKPIVVNFIGYPTPSDQLGNLFFVSSLDEAAEKSVALSNSKKKN